MKNWLRAARKDWKIKERDHPNLIKVNRIFNTYGSNMNADDGRVVSNFIVQALKGEENTIYSDGKQTQSFCYVDDLVEGMVRMIWMRFN